MTGGGLVDDAADVGGARVEDVVEALLEQFGGHGDVTLDDGDGLGIHIARDQLGERLAGLAGDLGWLGDHGIARCDGRRDGEKEQLDRVVPRGDDERDAERLGHDVALARHVLDEEARGLVLLLLVDREVVLQHTFQLGAVVPRIGEGRLQMIRRGDGIIRQAQRSHETHDESRQRDTHLLHHHFFWGIVSSLRAAIPRFGP